MKAYCIFDDYPKNCIGELRRVGVEVTAVERGQSRPNESEMKKILEKYDIIIIGTSQKLHEWMWEKVETPRIVATASAGIDHIKIPQNKKHLLEIINTPTANAQSVAEYTVGAMLLTRKRFFEGNILYTEGKNNKSLIRKPEDIHGTTVGLIGAGHISAKIMELLQPFGVNFLCHTKNPINHIDMKNRFQIEFVSLEELVSEANIISVNVPSDESTKRLINSGIIDRMKDDSIFICVSRLSVIDEMALLKKASCNPNFYMILDIDVMPELIQKNNGRNVIFTPHIAGGTIETRKRMFTELTNYLVNRMNSEVIK